MALKNTFQVDAARSKLRLVDSRFGRNWCESVV